MSQILVIVPPEWAPVDKDLVAELTNVSLAEMIDLQGRGAPSDLNDKLDVAGWFADERRIQDVLVLDDRLYFRIA